MGEKKRGPGRPPGSKNKNAAKSTSSKKVSPSVMKKEMRLESKAQIKDEVIGIVLIALGVFLVIALQTGAAGLLGEAISKGLKGLFAFIAYFLPYYFIVYGILLFLKKTIHIGIKAIIYLLVIYLAIVLVNAGRFVEKIPVGSDWGGFTKCFDDGVALNGGGVFGMGVGDLIANLIGIAGLYIFTFAVIFVFLLLLVNTPVSRFFENLKLRKQRRALEKEERDKQKAQEQAERYEQMKMEMADIKSGADENSLSESQRQIMGYVNENTSANSEDFDPASSSNRTTRSRKKTKGPEIIGAGLGTKEVLPEDNTDASKLTKKEAADLTLDSTDFISSGVDKAYEFPPIDILKLAKKSAFMASESELTSRATLLEETLNSFGIDATVTNVIQGPTVTRYEVHPHSGVKVSKIKNLIDDIALNMKAKSIRIEAPIPGKSAVGIEIENAIAKAVPIREVIDSETFKAEDSKVSFAVGRDIGGKEIVADLAKMPHLLIAGATGSGKSVCINSIIASLLYKARPDEVKMVLIDPKMVELSNYNGIPHLLIPVVTDPTKAAAALNWAVSEMDERYKKFAEKGVRNFSGYNKIMSQQKNKVRNDEVEGPLPQIVVIIDELADLMMVASSQVEESICRLAQKARAAGMHLIVATQRPSVNVITGLIKANIPSRIAFAVTSQVDSRTILDMVGAERLVGKGDMLFAPLGSNKPTRIQGTFISDEEVKKLIEFVKTQADVDEASEADVMDSISRANTPDAERGNRDFDDELLPEAIEFVAEAGKASVSMLQRRFRIGYNRAARIIDMMEDRQIVGPADGSRPRQVLISEEDLENMKENAF